jgi:hypothetical protein
VAFADRLLLNKTDLVSEAEKAAVIKRIRVRVQIEDTHSLNTSCYVVQHEYVKRPVVLVDTAAVLTCMRVVWLRRVCSAAVLLCTSRCRGCMLCLFCLGLVTALVRTGCAHSNMCDLICVSAPALVKYRLD